MGRVLMKLVSGMAFATVGGCTSMELPGPAGRPVLWGWGSSGPVPGSRGQVHRVVAPGLSLRLHSAMPGFSVGWHETLFFFPTNSGGETSDRPARAVAASERVYGLNLSPTSVALGADRVFGVVAPPAGKNVRQTLFFRANQASNTVIEYREFP